MWFKQVTPFRLLELPEKRYLDESLGNSWFTEPQGLDWFSEGFTYPTAPLAACRLNSLSPVNRRHH